MLYNLNVIAVASILSGLAAVVSIAGTLGLLKKKWEFNSLLNKWIKDEKKEAVLENSDNEMNNNAVTVEPEPQPGTEEIPPAGTLPPEQEIKDDTNTNIEQSIGNFDFNSILQQQKEWQKEIWEREDAIRKETQEREDNALQRAVADARKAGINPNLINLTPAESGGGITQGSGLNMDLYKGELDKMLSEWETLVNNELKIDENQKDRLSGLVNQLISTFAMYFLFKR